ncbi:MAG: WhiB family transcriptional regulator [Actinomycetota bacterium]
MHANSIHAPRDLEDGWQTLARCRGADATLFFSPAAVESKDEKDAREAKAKAICRECPVRADCLDFALYTREPYGIWGGMNETERRRLMARRAG